MGDPPEAGPNGRLRFGVFELDPRAGELRKRGLKVHLQQQPYELLRLLLEHPGEVVARETIRGRLWPSGIHVDFDRSLNKAVVKLREALGDSAESPRFVETLPRKGYRFIAPLGPGEPAAGRTVSGPAPDAATPMPIVSSGRHAWLAVSLAVFTVAIALLVGRDRLFRRPAEIRSVAVLPLENLSGDPGQDYFADGMTEALITDLGKIRALRVIPRTSVLRYKGTRKSATEIAHELGVDALVEGTLARSASRVRLTVNLVQASPERHLWAEAFERDLHDALSLQSELASAIARGVRARVTPEEHARLTRNRPVDPDAFELYLRGRYLCNEGPDEDLWKAVDEFRRAVARDPGFALGHAWLAVAYDYVADALGAPPKEVMPSAKVAALRALELDDSLAEAHAALSVVLLEYEWDWAGSEREIRRALELDPASRMAVRSYSWFLAYQGRFDEALVQARRFAELASPDQRTTGDMGELLVLARRYGEAERMLRETLSAHPDRPRPHRQLARIHLLRGETRDAIAEFQKAEELAGDPPGRPSIAVSVAKARAGDRKDAERMLTALEERARREHVPPDRLAVLATALGDRDAAFAWLEKAYEERSIEMVSLKIDPAFDPLRADPRFGVLLGRVGLAP